MGGPTEMTCDCIWDFLPHYISSQKQFISGGYSVIYRIGPMCPFPSPTLKYDLTFYQVQTRTEKHKAVLWPGKTWMRFQTWKLEEQECSGNFYATKTTKVR